MKIAIVLISLLSLFFLASAFFIVIGKGDWMISNYRHLSEEQKAKINIVRLRRLMAVMLVLLAVMVPVNFFVADEAQATAVAVVTVVAIFAFVIAAHFWAGMPLFINPFKK